MEQRHFPSSLDLRCKAPQNIFRPDQLNINENGSCRKLDCSEASDFVISGIHNKHAQKTNAGNSKWRVEDERNENFQASRWKTINRNLCSSKAHCKAKSIIELLCKPQGTHFWPLLFQLRMTFPGNGYVHVLLQCLYSLTLLHKINNVWTSWDTVAAERRSTDCLSVVDRSRLIFCESSSLDLLF